jgi:hypothetical protein
VSTLLEQLTEWAAANYAFERLDAELDAAGVTDPAERKRARRLLVDQLKVQRAAREAVGAVKH